MLDYINFYYKNVSGIKVIDSGRKGKNIGILAINHGDEKVGLEVFNYLENVFGIDDKLKSGKVYLIAVNLLAYKQNTRFIDDNMNRIWNKKMKVGSYEFIRMNDIKIILDEIDIAIDLHSVTKGDDKIGITDKKYLTLAKNILDVDTLLVDDIGKTGALTSYLINNNKIAFGVECGNHDQNDAYKVGISNVLNILSYFNFINRNIKINKTNLILEFKKEIIPQTMNFKYLKNYSGFVRLTEGEKYAIDGDIIWIAEENEYIGLVSNDIRLGDGSGFVFNKL